MENNRWSIQDLTRMALLTALLCASAYIAFPIPIIDLLGAAWYAVFAQIPLTTALLTAALPFLPGDIIKAVGAVLVYLPLRKALRQFSK